MTRKNFKQNKKRAKALFLCATGGEDVGRRPTAPVKNFLKKVLNNLKNFYRNLYKSFVRISINQRYFKHFLPIAFDL